MALRCRWGATQIPEGVIATVQRWTGVQGSATGLLPFLSVQGFSWAKKAKGRKAWVSKRYHNIPEGTGHLETLTPG